MSKTTIAIIIIIIVAGLGYLYYQSMPEEEIKDKITEEKETPKEQAEEQVEEQAISPEEEETPKEQVEEQVEEQAVSPEEKETPKEQAEEQVEEQAVSPEEEEESTPIPVQITFLEKLAADPSWSPDGSKIVFLGLEKDHMKGGFYMINSNGTGLTSIGPWERDHLFNPSWSPVGNKVIAYGERENSGLFLVDLDKNWAQRFQLTTQKSEMPSWSPDGKKIAYNVYNETKSFSSIWMMNVDGSGKTRLTDEEDDFCTGPSFSYDGSKIVYLKGFTSYAPESKNRPPNEIWVMNSDGTNKHAIYAPGDSSQVIRERAWNKNDKILFARHKLARGFPQIWVINSDGTNPQSIIEPPDGLPITIYDDPVWDNSGTKVAVTKVIGASGEIWQVATFLWEE
jgi:Tol biopolymer transport system component